MDKITVENINHPSKSERVNAGKYLAMRSAMLAVLTESAEPLDTKAIGRAVKPLLPDDLFPGGATSGWWIKTVQLDLEAKGILTRTATKPLRIFLTRRNSNA
ncbi:DUF6958 family protein [Hoeflea sp.]|uniref:DUF6958 family protein n=1 Tax=Hoeflea sp. TaxID=1940281 RepID=UPI0037485D1F